jgi:hypothetical protein
VVCLALALGAGVGVLAEPSVVQAQGDVERAGARAAAEAGVQAFGEGRFQDAVDLFTRAESLVHATPHLLYIARASEKLGRLVAAREAYTKIVREPLAPNAPAAFVRAKTEAEQELAALQPRIPMVTVKIQGNGADIAQVTVDGKEIPKALIGIPIPIDPGKHDFKAVAGGASSQVVTKSIPEKSKESVLLVLTGEVGTVAPAAPAAGTEKPGAAAGAEGAGGAAEPAKSPTKDRGAESKGGSKVPAYVAFGVGGVGAAVGTVFLLQFSKNNSDYEAKFEDCKKVYCENGEADITALREDAQKAGTLAVIGYGVGAVGIGTGIVLLATSKKKTDAAYVRPWVGLHSAGVEGRF